MKVVGYYGESWLSDIPRQVREAEALGLDAISAAEIKHNSILALTLAAEHTERIEVGTGVTIAFPRSPMIIAQAGWDLQEFSRGRVNIGLGTQVKGHNQRRFSVPWIPPYQRLKDYVGMVRAVWESWQTGERPEYNSENYTYTLMTPNFDPGPLPYPFPKISLGAVGPTMAYLAGEVADVLLPHGFMTKEYLGDVLVPAAQRGARKAGRDPKELEISVGGFFALGETQTEVEQAIDRNRQFLSFYGSTRTYHAVFRHHEREALGMQLHEMSLRGEWDKMASAVPFNVAQEMSIACTYDELPAHIRQAYPYATRISIPNVQQATGDGLSTPGMTPERARWLLAELQKI